MAASHPLRGRSCQTLGVFPPMGIRPFRPSDEAAAIALWEEAGLTRPWNNPYADIARKLTAQPELFLVSEIETRLVGTAMVGLDGHRGWGYYLAVAFAYRKQSIGRALMGEAERLLAERGCSKLNLLVRSSNADVVAFYAKLGYTQDDVVCLGKRLIHDQTPGPSIEQMSSGKLRLPAGAAPVKR
jgi:ribosomal protein S18 acetylase RimI-like enzyme